MLRSLFLLLQNHILRTYLSDTVYLTYALVVDFKAKLLFNLVHFTLTEIRLQKRKCQ